MINYLFTIPVSFMYDHKMLLNITYLYIIKKTNGTVNCIHTNLMTLFQLHFAERTYYFSFSSKPSIAGLRAKLGNNYFFPRKEKKPNPTPILSVGDIMFLFVCLHLKSLYAHLLLLESFVFLSKITFNFLVVFH